MDSSYYREYSRKAYLSMVRRGIEALGGACTECGESDWVKLEFDHVNSDGQLDKIDFGRNWHRQADKVGWVAWPRKLQLLCGNHNRKKEINRHGKPASKEAAYVRSSNIELKKQTVSAYSRTKEPICDVCGNDDLDVIELSHVNNDGAVHRKEISGGKGSKVFYRALRKLGFPNDREMRPLCRSCHLEIDRATT